MFVDEHTKNQETRTANENNIMDYTHNHETKKIDTAYYHDNGGSSFEFGLGLLPSTMNMNMNIDNDPLLILDDNGDSEDDEDMMDDMEDDMAEPIVGLFPRVMEYDLYGEEKSKKVMKIYGEYSINTTIAALAEVQNNTELTQVELEDLDIDPFLEGVIVRVLQTPGRLWEHIGLSYCAGEEACILGIVTVALGLNVESLEFRNDEDVDISAVFSHYILLILATGFALNTQLSKLYLSSFVNWRSTEPEDVRALAAALAQNTSLQELSLEGCGLKDECLAVLLGALEENRTLKVLDLSGNTCGPLSFAVLGSVLASSDCCITELNLSNQCPHCNTGIEDLCSALIRNTSLVKLNVRDRGLNDEDLQQIAVALRSNTTLQDLDTSYNKITDDGIISFVEDIPRMKSLRVWKIWNNPFTEKGGTELLKAMRISHTLCIRLDSNCCTMAREIQHYSHLNVGGWQEAAADFENIPHALWPLVLEKANKSRNGRLSSLMYAVREGNVCFLQNRDNI